MCFILLILLSFSIVSLPKHLNFLALKKEKKWGYYPHYCNGINWTLHQKQKNWEMIEYANFISITETPLLITLSMLTSYGSGAVLLCIAYPPRAWIKYFILDNNRKDKNKVLPKELKFQMSISDFFKLF